MIAHGQRVAVQGQLLLVCSIECTPPEAQVVQVPLHLRDWERGALCATCHRPIRVLDAARDYNRRMEP